MPLDLDSLADLVVLTVKDAIAPMQQELALVKQDNAHLRASLAVVPELRDRIVAVETKSASVVAPVAAPVAAPVEVDLSPITERLALIEQDSAGLKASLIAVTELRDRVVVVETKALSMQPVPQAPARLVDLSPLIERIAAIEHQQETAAAALETVTELRDRVVAVETKAGAIEIPDPVDVTPLAERLAAVESHVPRLAKAEQTLGELRERVTTVETKSAEVTPLQAIPADVLSQSDVELAIRQRLDPVIADVTSVRERVIAVEARAPIQGPTGPAGRDGVDGKDGKDGRDGVDGIGPEDFDSVVDEDGRTFSLKFQRGLINKVIPLPLRTPQYEGVYIEGKSYQRGQMVTWAGSMWHANKETRSKPGEESRDWTLVVKRGRDGKDGKDAPQPMPVVKVR